MPSLAQEIGHRVSSFEHAERVEEFFSALRHMAIARHTNGNAAKLARAANASPRVLQFVERAAVGAGAIADPNWSALSPHSLSASFLQSLVGISLFQTMLGSMLVLPARTSVLSVTAAPSAGQVAEASVKPVSRLSVSASDLDPVKCATLIVTSAELLKVSPTLGENLLRRELTSAVVRAVDQTFLGLIGVNVPTITSSGSTTIALRRDLTTLLMMVPSGTTSRLFWLMPPGIAKSMSLVGDTTGQSFPQMGATGGSIAGLPALTSDQVGVTDVWLLDAASVAANAGDLVIDLSRQSTINLDTVGDSPVTSSTVTTSLWQANLVGLRCERPIAARLLNASSIARVTGVSSGNSP